MFRKFCPLRVGESVDGVDGVTGATRRGGRLDRQRRQGQRGRQYREPEQSLPFHRRTLLTVATP
jgi:hypothetical protein